MSVVDTVMKMKAELEAAQNKKARIEGEMDSIAKQLQDMGMETTEAAEAEIERLEEEEEALVKEIERTVESLKSAYDWKTL